MSKDVFAPDVWAGCQQNPTFRVTNGRCLMYGADEQCVFTLVSMGISVEENTAFRSATDSCKCRILEGALLYTRFATLVAELVSHKEQADLTLSSSERHPTQGGIRGKGRMSKAFSTTAHGQETSNEMWE